MRYAYRVVVVDDDDVAEVVAEVVADVVADVHAIVVVVDVVVVAVVVVLRGQTANRRVADHAAWYFCDRSTPAAEWQCPG